MVDKIKYISIYKEEVNNKIEFITSTKRGDSGQTRLLSGEKLSKSNARIEVCGNLDESNAALGLAKTFTKNPHILKIISTIQGELVLLRVELSSTSRRANVNRIELENVSQLERWINKLQKKAPVSSSLVKPGVNSASAALDFACSVIRRTERSMVVLLEMGQPGRAEVLKYINRLGCLLHILARCAEKSP